MHLRFNVFDSPLCSADISDLRTTLLPRVRFFSLRVLELQQVTHGCMVITQTLICIVCILRVLQCWPWIPVVMGKLCASLTPTKFIPRCVTIPVFVSYFSRPKFQSAINDLRAAESCMRSWESLGWSRNPQPDMEPENFTVVSRSHVLNHWNSMQALTLCTFNIYFNIIPLPTRWFPMVSSLLVFSLNFPGIY